MPGLQEAGLFLSRNWVGISRSLCLGRGDEHSPFSPGNAGLLALADVFSEDSSSSLCQLDISSNCIKPDGLLEFAKRLERWGRGAFGHLRLFQNWLDQDAVTAREAIRRLRATCHVVSDSWDSSQAFADYVSTM